MRVALALLLGLGACAGMPGSYVSPDIREADAPVLAQGVAGFVTLRGASGPVAVSSPADDALLAPQVDRALRNAGFAVAAGGGQRLSYQVDPRPDGALVRVTLDTARGARAYTRTQDGSLAPAGPYTVTLAEASR